VAALLILIRNRIDHYLAAKSSIPSKERDAGEPTPSQFSASTFKLLSSQDKWSFHFPISISEMDKLMDMQKANISLPEEILQAIELTHESNYTPEQLAAYDKYIDAIRTEKTLIAEAEVKGEARGETKGKRQTAINLKKLGLLTNQQIAEATGLTLSEIEAL